MYISLLYDIVCPTYDIVCWQESRWVVDVERCAGAAPRRALELKIPMVEQERVIPLVQSDASANL